MTKPTAARGKAAPAYGTGRSESAVNGYPRIWSPGHPLAMADGYVLEHRLVWFEHHGPIPEGFEVHHEDRDHGNNDISNLSLLTEAEHHAEHARLGTTVRNQYGTWEVGAGQGAALRRRRAEATERNCVRCGGDIAHLKLDARYCGGQCRIAAFKERRRCA